MKNKGFTLIEVLMFLMIIAILGLTVLKYAPVDWGTVMTINETHLRPSVRVVMD